MTQSKTELLRYSTVENLFLSLWWGPICLGLLPLYLNCKGRGDWICPICTTKNGRSKMIQREKRQSKNKLSALCLKNNNKTKKTKARQKYGTHALTRFYEIQQKCELSCQFHIWFFFCHIYHKESEQKQSHYCSCTLWYFGTRPFCAYMPRCFYKTIKTAVLIRYLEEQKSWRLKYQWSSYDHKWVLHK